MDKYKNLNTEELHRLADSEAIADCCETMLQNSKLFENLINENRNFAQKLIDAIKKAIAELRAYFKDNDLQAKTEYGQALFEAMDKVENRVQELWDKAVAEGIKAEKAESGIRYMARDFEGNRFLIPFRDKEKIKAALQKTREEIKSRNMIVTIKDDIDSTIDYNNPKEGRDYIKSILKKSLGINVELGVDNHTLIARLTREGLNHASKYNNNKDKAALFEKFIELAGSSIYSYSTIQDKKHSSASENINENAYWDSFLSVAHLGDKNYNVIFSVRSIDSDVRGQIYDSWIKKEANASHDAGTQNDSANGQSNYGSQIASNNIISDSSQKINTPDEKSSDPVTYDDNGNVIPLSERFNEEKEDIRYSDRNINFFIIDRYTKRDYNNYGWAIVNNVLSKKEQTKLFAQFADKETLNSKYRKSFDDCYMIPVGHEYSYNNKIVFVEGNNQNPVIDRIITITGDNEQEIGFYLDEVIEDGGQLDILGYCEQSYGKKLFAEYKSSDFETYDVVRERWERYKTTGSPYSNEDKGRKNGPQERGGTVKSQDRYDEYDDLFDMGDDLFEDDSKRQILDELIEKYPDDALYIIKNAAEQTVEDILTKTKSIKLDEAAYLQTAWRFMQDYNISRAANPNEDTYLAAQIKNIVARTESGELSRNEIMNEFFNVARDALVLSGTLDDSMKEERELIQEQNAMRQKYYRTAFFICRELR